jgi:hypothetical protein
MFIINTPKNIDQKESPNLILFIDSYLANIFDTKLIMKNKEKPNIYYLTTKLFFVSSEVFNAKPINKIIIM